MRSPGVLYREYRKVKRKMLYLKISESFKKAHKNCAYGLAIDYTDTDNSKNTTKACVYAAENGNGNQVDLKKMDICTCAATCNAFAPKKNRDEIVAEFNIETENITRVHHLYPELYSYQWMLDKDLEDAKKEPSFLNKFYISAIGFFEKLLKISKYLR